MSYFTGRLVDSGLAIETTSGTAEAPAYPFQRTTVTVFEKIEAKDLESTFGVIDAIIDSYIVKQYSMGNVEGPVYDKSIGEVLAVVFGANPSSSATADGSGLVYKHTYTRSNANAHKTCTITEKDSVATRVYAQCGIDKFSVKAAIGEEMTWNADFMGKKAATTPAWTPSYAAENPFFSGQIVVKFADDTTGFGAASDIKATSFELNFEKKLQLLYGINDIEPHSTQVNEFRVSGTVELDYLDDTYVTLFKANTTKAVQIIATNSKVTIGTSANPIIEFNLHAVKIRDLTPEYGQGTIVKHTLQLTALYKAADTATAKAFLTNLTTQYS